MKNDKPVTTRWLEKHGFADWQSAVAVGIALGLFILGVIRYV